MKDLLLHCCCAPCGAGCAAHPFLLEQQFTPALLYFSNSNLDSEAEFNRRLEYVTALGKHFSIPVAVDPYDHAAWLEAVRGFENEPECGARCERCFAFSLSRAAKMAQELGINFATTLTVSPRKSSKKIFECGAKWKHFSPLDFKKKNGYLTGTRLANELGFYRQNYCGCEFSKVAASTSGKSSITPPPDKNPSGS